ncbi:MAG: hypothetical protein ABWY06_17355 [Pseudomonas sp.]|uniref:hypothetical protein n=1 Tax=Pseudomonas sp. TaxID=306 RepID=UPI0033986B32
MTFSLYALLSDDSSPVSNESLAIALQEYLRNENNFSLQFERLPFAKNQTLALRWGSWLVRVSYEEGDAVKQDSIGIQKKTAATSEHEVSHIKKRIRLVIGSDDNQHFTNQLIYLIDFLRTIKGVLIFDPQQNDFVN